MFHLCYILADSKFMHGELPLQVLGSWGAMALSYYCDIMLLQEFKPMGAQHSLKAVLALAERLATASNRCSKIAPRSGLVNSARNKFFISFGQYECWNSCNMANVRICVGIFNVWSITLFIAMQLCRKIFMFFTVIVKIVSTLDNSDQ